MVGFYVILTIAILYTAFMGGVIGFLIGKYWKNKQRMKIRLAKEIMTPSFRNGKMGYWHSRYDLHCMWLDGCIDHRITNAISLVERWNARRYRNEAAKINKKNPFRPRDLRRSVERLKHYSV